MGDVRADLSGHSRGFGWGAVRSAGPIVGMAGPWAYYGVGVGATPTAGYPQRQIVGLEYDAEPTTLRPPMAPLSADTSTLGLSVSLAVRVSSCHAA